MRVRWIMHLVVFCVACSVDRTAARVDDSALSIRGRASNEFVLDVSRAGAAFVAQTVPPPENSDADRLLRVRLIDRFGLEQPWRYHGADVLDVRFVPNATQVLVLTASHTLERLDRADGAPIEIDRDVLGPISIDAAGHVAAYVRGEIPEYRLRRIDLASGQIDSPAPGLVPAWSPVILDGGDDILVVASPHGRPEWFRVRVGSAPQALSLAPGTPLPTGPGAPLVDVNRVIYESDGAVCTIDLATTTFGCEIDRRLPFFDSRRSQLVMHDRANHLRVVTHDSRMVRNGSVQ